MNTIKDLRDFISARGGAIYFGENNSLTYSEGGDGDVDLKINGRLIAWVSSTEPEETKIESMKVYFSGTLLANKSSENKNEKDTPTEDKEKNIALGMVAAYEKILLGRDLQVGR